jgi:LPXTG-motif cell wall-anchored protein
LLLLGLLIVQSLTPVSLVFAEKQENFNSDKNQAEKRTNLTKSSDEKELSTPNDSKQSGIETTSETELPVTPPAATNTTTSIENDALPSASTITDELLSTMTISSMDGEEYSKTKVNRLKNSTPIVATLDFAIDNPGYLAGSVYTAALPEALGYTDMNGKVSGIDADWTVDAENKTVSILFNQRVSDVNFQLKIKCYIYAENNPAVTVITPGKTENKYIFDLFEEIESIKYEEARDTFGLNGTVYYNVDRKLSGQQTLELLMTEGKDAQFQKQDAQEISVSAYDVDVKGNILTETKQTLVKGSDYTITADTMSQTAVVIANMDQHKAYGLSFERAIALTSVSNYNYSFYEQYPTTELGTVRLNSTSAEMGGLAFTAKTSQDQKVIKELAIGGFLGAGFQSKGIYNLMIYNVPTLTKAGEKIVIESQNGQAITLEKPYAKTTAAESVEVADYFDIEEEGNKIIFTAKQDNVLKMSLFLNLIDFEEKDIKIAVNSPVVQSEKSILLISDQYIDPISLIHANNAETAWGNFDRNGSYLNRTEVTVIGSDEAPVENLEITVKHPEYLTLRAPKSVLFFYELDRDYTITETSAGAVIKFTTPIKHKIEIPIGFNYVPDSLAIDESIPIDTLPITIKADNYDTLNETITTNSKPYSEATLQARDNQFLVNARNDSYDSLVVKTKMPTDVALDFKIYDVSNDNVSSIYPQFWERGYYFDNPLTPDSEGYPNITFDQSTNSYTFDFGKTSKRYIIAYTHANGWIDTKTAYVVGSTIEPLDNNQEISRQAVVTNDSLNILQASLSNYDALKKVTVGKVQTKYIDDQTHKVKNPVFEIVTKGTTNAGIDQNSVSIEGIPEDVYHVESAAGIKIIFDDYTLTENITIDFKVISENAGEVYTETTIDSESLSETSDSCKIVASQPIVLQFSAGDAEGIVSLSKLSFYTYKATDKTKPVGNVHFVLTDKLTGDSTEFTSDDAGKHTFEGVMSGNYLLKITEVPQGYAIPDEYQTDKEITINKGENKFEIPIIVAEDKTSVTIKDSTIYVGTSWEAQDNFVAATDSSGNAIDLSELEVEGSVDTRQVGDYSIIYRNGNKEATAVVHVIADQKTLVVKDLTLYVGDAWSAENSLVSATDSAGNSLSVDDLEIEGAVDTAIAGTYPVTYRNGSLQEIATITVKPDLTTLIVKDSTIHVGDSWSARDNFVSATNRDGQELDFEELEISGAVDNQTIGTYQVQYRVTIAANADQRNMKLTREKRQAAKVISAVATITVQENPKPDDSSQSREEEEIIVNPGTSDAGESSEDTSTTNNTQDSTEPSDAKIGANEQSGKPNNSNTDNQAADNSANENANLNDSRQNDYPETGTKNNTFILLAGLAIVVGVGGLVVIRKRKTN